MRLLNCSKITVYVLFFSFFFFKTYASHDEVKKKNTFCSELLSNSKRQAKSTWSYKTDEKENAEPQFGYLKCRLIHMKGKSVIQPDVLMCAGQEKMFVVPQFFFANWLEFNEDNPNQEFGQLLVEMENKSLIKIIFFRREKKRVYADGSIVYRCRYLVISGPQTPRYHGKWRKCGENFQLLLFHHTNGRGYEGILSSRRIWGSNRNIDGQNSILNIKYGYFTSLPQIQNEIDLRSIAMSNSGLTAFLPTNKPYDMEHAILHKVPIQTSIERSKTLKFWIDVDLLSPNHLWFHPIENNVFYYELVLPKVFRVGIQPGDSDLLIIDQQITLDSKNRKIFKYVIVGNADTEEGLIAPFHERDLSSIGFLEQIESEDDIISVLYRLRNTNQYEDRIIEFINLQIEIEG